MEKLGIWDGLRALMMRTRDRYRQSLYRQSLYRQSLYNVVIKKLIVFFTNESIT
jgi:hypothetical protein